ncbi:MAG: iron-sulfur cluster-binding oxidoreductase [Clostridia bacterium]|nr:iron-sulfur cluster-binding oxidoreductase [Clostridia bacterium]
MSIIKPHNPWENNDPFASAERLENGDGFKLLQWPIKLWKISETAPFFHGAHLLIAADCVGFTYVPLHEKYTPGRIPLICCPENDFDVSTKLAKIISINDIRSVSVIRMDSKCCANLTSMVQQAIKISKKPLPLQTTTVFIDAEEVE